MTIEKPVPLVAESLLHTLPGEHLAGHTVNYAEENLGIYIDIVISRVDVATFVARAYVSVRASGVGRPISLLTDPGDEAAVLQQLLAYDAAAPYAADHAGNPLPEDPIATIYELRRLIYEHDCIRAQFRRAVESAFVALFCRRFASNTPAT